MGNKKILTNSKIGPAITIIIMFMLCPVFSIIYIIYNIYKGRYNGLIWLSLTMSVIAMSTPVFADLYRHTLLYFSYVNYSNYELIQSKNGNDFIFYSLTQLFANNGIPFEFISALFIFICYQISFYFFHCTIDASYAKSWTNKVKFYVFLVFFLMVPFIAIMDGLRMGTASYIAALGWFYCYNKKHMKGVFFYLIACATHYGSSLFLPLFIFTIVPYKKINHSIFIFAFIFLLMNGSILLHLLPSSFIYALNVEKQVDFYMVNSVERFDDMSSFNGTIALYLERLPLLFILLLVMFKKIKSNNKDMPILYFIFLLMCLYHPFRILFQRYAYFAIPIVVFLSFKTINKSYSQPLKFVRYLFVICCINNLSYMYGYRTVLQSTKFYNLLLPPVYTILNTDTVENFKDALIPQ